LIAFLKKNDLEPVIVCHDDRDVPIAQEMYPELEILFSNYQLDYVDFYSNALMVIGSRLHATIMVSGLGIPSVNINLDLRGKGFSETFGLSDWNIDYTDPDAEIKLEDRVKRVMNGDLSYLKDYSGRREHYRLIFNDFMKKTADTIIGFGK